MRVVSWVFVLCTTLGVVGVFLPCLELQVRGGAVSKRAAISLYTASTKRELVRRSLAAYHSSDKRRTAAEVVRAVESRTKGRVKSALEDARDAMGTLDDTSDDDVKLAGIALSVAVWTLLGLYALGLLLVFTQLMGGVYWRGRLVGALVASGVAAVIAVGLSLVCREVAWQANDEVGRTVVALAVGAYVAPLAAIGSVAGAVVLVTRSRRTRLSPPHDR